MSIKANRKVKISYPGAWGISRPGLGVGGSKISKKNFLNIFFFQCTQKGKWIHPGSLTFPIFPNSEPRYLSPYV